MLNCPYDVRKSKMNTRIDNLRFSPTPVRDIDPYPPSREVGSEVARGGDTLRYLARLPLFSFPDNVLDTKVTSPYFVVLTGQDNSTMREI